MGTVYLAEQDNPRRPVAVKIMQAALWSGSAQRRFEYESHILGRLQHPNIAQVFEAGAAELDDDSASPVSFFAMEYVPGGLPITEYADRRKLGIRERRELFLQACDGVHYGHQKGVIHRDLKPGNILVASEQSRDRQQAENSDGGPLSHGCGSDLAHAAGPTPQAFVKLIDFRVARCTDSDIAVTTMHTDVGQLIGTLAYMSPEQCDGDPLAIDTRSDVYSLGVVLYELLCGKLPYELTTRSIPRATRTICEEAPVRPSTIDRKLRGDLELLVLKALEKDRDKRYPSVDTLAGDIRRYLHGEPIEARPPTAWTRVVRLIARHPVITSAVASIVIAFASLTATLVTIWVLKARPNEMRLSQDGREATLISVAGAVLKDWKTKRSSGIRFAELVPPAELGGERLALLGFDQARGQRFPNSLCAYGVRGDFEVLAWERHIESDEILPQLREQRDRPLAGEDFGISLCEIADVFPESPGDEIIAVHTCPSSIRILRIYDLMGEILFQVWHRGTLNSCYWLSGPRLLVFSGDNAEAYWDRRSHPEARPMPYPLIVFALRPKFGFLSQTYLSSTAGSDPLSPVWYKCLLPPKESAIVDSFHLVPPPRASDAHRFVNFDFYVNVKEGTGVSWTLNEDGEEVPGSRVANDDYMRQRESANPVLPDPKGFHLGELPPLSRSFSDDPPKLPPESE